MPPRLLAPAMLLAWRVGRFPISSFDPAAVGLGRGLSAEIVDAARIGFIATGTALMDDPQPPVTVSDDAAPMARPLGWIAAVVARYPAAVVAISLGLAAVAVWLTVDRLGFRTSRLDLLNPESTYNRLWIDYIDEFGDDDDAVIVVEGDSEVYLTPVLEEISTALEQRSGLFHAILHEVDLSAIRSKGLHYLGGAELNEIERFLDRAQPILGGDWSQLNLGRMLAGGVEQLKRQTGRGDGIAEVARLAAGLSAIFDERSHYRSPWPEMTGSIGTLSHLGSEYLLTDDGRLGFVLLRLAKDADGGFARGSAAIDTLREVLDGVAARHPQVEIGLTGLPVMENDEMRASQQSMLRASVLSVLGVTCLFVAGFGGIRYPLMTILALLVGMAWSFGYITLFIGHLNILSVSFAVILIGLGIDFGLHFVARYQLLSTRQREDKAAVATARCVGPGVLTGAVTTAIAFFTAGLTDFTGIAELGLVAGGGILLCGLSAIVLLPALLVLSDRRRSRRYLPEPLPVGDWVSALMGSPRLLLALSLAFTAVVAFGMSRVRYDHNLLNLQPIGLESVQLERKLLAESDQSVWFALSMAESREELLARKARFLELPSVERTEEIASLLPTDHETKKPHIERIAQRLESLPERPPLVPVDSPDQLGRVLAEAQRLVERRPDGGRCGRQLEQIRDVLRRTPVADCYQRLSSYQQQMAGDFLSRLHAIRSMANPEPPEWSDLPSSLVSRFVGQHGRHLLKIYGRGNIWDMEALERFVTDVRSVDPRATGNPLQTYEASLEMRNSYQEAAVYSLIAIMMVLVIDFRHLRHVALALLPVLFGALQTFGILGVLDIPLNPANMIVLPLILGIGIDDGVHILHDFRCQAGRYRMSGSTATSVLITSLTTMVGFGSLMIASHQGLRSLGQVLAIGVGCCLFTSLVMLPALLTLLTRHRPVGTPEDDIDGHRDLSRGGTMYRHDGPHNSVPPAEDPARPSKEHSGWGLSRSRG